MVTSGVGVALSLGAGVASEEASGEGMIVSTGVGSGVGSSVWAKTSKEGATELKMTAAVAIAETIFLNIRLRLYYLL